MIRDSGSLEVAARPYETTVSLDGVDVTFQFDRGPVERPPEQYDTWNAAGFVALHPEFEGADLEEIREEQAADGGGSRAVAPSLIVGLLLSEEFSRHTEPFTSLGDEQVRDDFRAIADIMIDKEAGRLQHGSDPLTLSRAALLRSLQYPDGIGRDWDRDEVTNQLAMSFAERGYTFQDSEHMDKSNPKLDWPGTVARMLRTAFDLGRSDVADDLQYRTSIERDFQTIMISGGLSEAELQTLADTTNALAARPVVQ